MQCYRHQERPAIAICRHCGKATCSNCGEDTGHGVACNSGCAAELQNTYRLTTRLKRNYGVGLTPPIPASVSTYAFFGVILAAVGAYLSVSRGTTDYLSFAMAAVFFVMSWSSFRRFRQSCSDC